MLLKSMQRGPPELRRASTAWYLDEIRAQTVNVLPMCDGEDSRCFEKSAML
jgi:hypothetical protein